MTQAVCENDHPMQPGESRCSQCGGRLKMQWMDEARSDVAAGSSKRSAVGTIASVVTAVAAVVLAVSYLLVNFAGVGQESSPSEKKRDTAEMYCTMDPGVTGGIYSEEFRNCVEQQLR